MKKLVLAPKNNTKTNVKIKSIINVEMIWIPWSEKSKDILFKSSVKGVGDGEQKVAKELDTHVLGQNSSYDMMPILNGIKVKCDVKKLDVQNDFNTGKEARDIIRPIKMLHTILLDSINIFVNSDIFTSDEKATLSWFNDVSPDELAVGTLKKIKMACIMLSSKKKYLRSTLPLVQFTAHNQTTKMSLDLFYDICKKTDLVFPQEYSSYMETIRILQKMDHIYIDEPEKFMDDLNSIVDKIFRDIKLIIVHQEKGYMIINDINKIQFYRITRGNPRFKIIF